MYTSLKINAKTQHSPGVEMGKRVFDMKKVVWGCGKHAGGNLDIISKTMKGKTFNTLLEKEINKF